MRQVLLGPGDVFASMEKGGEFRIVVLRGHQYVSLEDGFEPIERLARSVAYRRKMFDVREHLALMPRHQNRLYVREVLVERRSTDPGFSGDERHRH